MPTINELQINPDFLLIDIDATKVRFAHLCRQSYYHSSFLDHRMTPPPTGAFHASIHPFRHMHAITRHPGLIIAHSSFCGSTYLSRCLQNERLLVLREPGVLGQLADVCRFNPQQFPGRLNIALRLLGKTYDEQQQVCIKPGNYSNNILSAVLDSFPDITLLILWGSLDQFLVSMTKHKTEAEKYLQHFAVALMLDHGTQLASAREYVGGLNLYQQAAMVWVLQMQMFSRLIDEYPDNIHVLPANTMFNQTVDCLARIYELQNIEYSLKDIEMNVNAMSGVDAKSAAPMLSEHLQDMRNSLKKATHDEYTDARKWLDVNGYQHQDLSVYTHRQLL